MRPVVALSFFLIFIYNTAAAQLKTQRELPANRTSGVVKIDGVLNDSAWKDAAVMTDMLYFKPKTGQPEAWENRTVAYLMYNDEGIYFGGFCHERTRDSIATELTGKRDGFGTNDYIGVIFDTYNDKLNGFEYFVTPLNEQWDAKANPPTVSNNDDNDNSMEDFSWNAVWKSGTAITDSGWSFEMFIPFSAIRFGKKDVQDWGLNISRQRIKTSEQNAWNPIDVNINGFLTQEGLWKGLSNIQPPLRLQFSPYFSVYANHYPYNQPGQKNWTSQVNGGMDVKYGINQAFTLDATLIPDFGQVQSDNQVLNLSPFEVKYSEYRNFFTEGTELFSKGNLFYSRRIGGSPLHLYDVYNRADSSETVIKNPTESKLINATKISGRTQKGLGIGFLNAITNPQYATIENTTSKQQWKEETDPLTNYNVLVLDQTLKNNSSVSLVNTNVWRSGHDYDANVTAGLFELNNKKNTYNAGGKLAVSNRYGLYADGKTQTGVSHELHVGKTSGKFTFNLSQERTDTSFTSNDLGYFTNNNFLDHSLRATYIWNEPKNWYNRINVNLYSELSMLATKIPTVDQNYQSANIFTSVDVQTKTLFTMNAGLGYIFKKNDFYEPRQTGWFFKRGTGIDLEVAVESNESKKYTFGADVEVLKRINFYHVVYINAQLEHGMRFNDHFSLTHELTLNPIFNNIGYTYIDGNTDINFARRKVNTIENVISAKYSFNNQMGVTLRARHYMSSVNNKAFYLLQHDGSLLLHSGFYPAVNQDVNYFNIDMVYSWQFAPGSFFNMVWKNATQYLSGDAEQSYFKNFRNTVTADNNNNLSIKVIYFLDYLDLKKELGGKL